MQIIYEKTSRPFSVSIIQNGGLYRIQVSFKNQYHREPLVLIHRECVTQRQAKRFLLDAVNSMRVSLEKLGSGIRKEIRKDKLQEGKNEN